MLDQRLWQLPWFIWHFQMLHDIFSAALFNKMEVHKNPVIADMVKFLWEDVYLAFLRL